MRRFCPSCGKPTQVFFEGLCKDCFLKRTPIVQAPPRIVARVCSICGKAAVNDDWQAMSKRELIQAAGKKAAKLARGAKLEVRAEKFKISELETARTVPILMRATLEVDGKKVFDEVRTILELQPAICKDCSRQAGHYYEATLQLRGGETTVKKMQQHIAQRVQELAKTHRLSFVSKIGKVRGGLDINIGSKEVAEKIAEELRRLKKAQIKRSFTIAGMREGKQFYRETILVRAGEDGPF